MKSKENNRKKKNKIIYKELIKPKKRKTNVTNEKIPNYFSLRYDCPKMHKNIFYFP